MGWRGGTEKDPIDTDMGCPLRTDIERTEKEHRAHLGCRRGAHIGSPNGLERSDLEGAHVYGSMGCPLGADIERADKITQSPSGLSTWGRYWQPKWAGEVGPRRNPYIRIDGLPIWGGHRARGQKNTEPIWAAAMGPI